jgi:DNA-binding transcriptional LysR family regulator
MNRLGNVDLNLLTPLGALLDERHVSRAAARAGLSQPAMSRVLQRLREALGDELLIRHDGGYRLTPRAQRIRRQLTTLMPQLDTLFTDRSFDPATARETFRVTGNDYGAAILGGSLMRRIRTLSAGSAVIFGGWHEQIFDDLERGVTDVVVRAVPGPSPLITEQIFADRFVAVMAPDHPLSTRTRLSMAEYLACDHLAINLSGGGQVIIDQRLAHLGQERLACRHAGAGMRIVAVPVEIEPIRYQMIWHPRLDADPAQRWLRDSIRAVANGLPAVANS